MFENAKFKRLKLEAPQGTPFVNHIRLVRPTRALAPFVELHGGKVTLDSIVGHGTTAVCTFPIKRTPGGEHAQRTAA